MVCDRCNGKRRVKILEYEDNDLMEKCYKCNGSGEIDWLSDIFQEEQTKVKRNFKFDDFSVSVLNSWSKEFIFNRLSHMSWMIKIFEKS